MVSLTIRVTTLATSAFGSDFSTHIYTVVFLGETVHPVTLVIPSKFTISTMSHLPLFPLYMAWGGHLASSWYFFLTY